MDSISHDQLMGRDLTIDELHSCWPAITNAEMNKVYSVDGSLLDPEAAAFPCGVVAKSFFNDTFQLYKQNLRQNQSREIRIDEEGIAWISDRKIKFKNLADDDWQKRQWIDVTYGKYPHQ